MEYSQSLINCFNQCRQKFKYRYVDKLTPKVTGMALRLGTMFHESISAHYTGKEFQYPVAFDIDEQRKELIMMQGLTEAYKEFYKNDSFEVIESEIRRHEPLRKHIRGVAKSDTFSFTPDGIFRRKSDGKVCLMEFKTKGRFDYSMIERLDIDMQVQIYLFFLFGQGIHIDEVVYRIIKKPAIRQTQKESIDEFIIRLKEEIRNNPEKYFIEVILPVNHEKMKECYQDLLKQIKLIRHCKRIKCYDKNTSSCQIFGTCEYMPLCLGQEGAEYLFQEESK